ncbi:hypothetical protein [Roseibium sp.]|uniref:hypothetical protein n=1 Tax=Roseibium sp. TaxID=1936156 RepID=UPI003BA86AC5
MKAISISTLQEIKDHGHQLSISCNRPWCNNYSYLDLEKLIDKFGPDYHATGNPDFVRRYICSRCGSKNVQLTVHAPWQRKLD